MAEWDPASLYRTEHAVEDARAPCASYGLHSKLFVLRETGAEERQFAGRESAWRSASFFLYCGMAALIGAFVVAFKSLFAALITAVLGALFVWTALFTLRDLYRRRVFDKAARLYVKDAAGTQPETRIALADIAALQLLNIHVPRKRKTGGYDYVELNLVLRDGTRSNVVVDGGVRRLEKDARTLAAFLGVPLWRADAIKPL